MDLLLWVLFGVIPAIAVMLVGVGVVGPRWLALALAVAICVPFLMADGAPGWPWHLDPHNGEPRSWLWWLVLAGGVLGALYDLRWLPRWIAVALELSLVLLLPWLLSGPLRAEWQFEWCVVFLSAGWLLQLANWWVLRRAAKARDGMAVPFAMAMVLAVDAALLRENAGGADWQLAGVAAIALGFAVVTTSWIRPFVCGGGAALAITIAHTGLLLCGRDEAELTCLWLVLALCAPLPMAVTLLDCFSKARTTGAVFGVVGTAGFAACALWAAT